jgi:DNA-binding transcriptional LysR family regulator
VENRVAEHTLDIGFIEAPSHLQNVSTDVCCEDELQAICAPSHPLARLKSAMPKQFVQYPFISRESGSGTREVIDHYLQKAGIPPESLNIVMELGSPEALKGLVATGLGFTIMSLATVSKETKLGQLVRVAALAAPDSQAFGGVPEGTFPLTAREHVRAVRQGTPRGAQPGMKNRVGSR